MNSLLEGSHIKRVSWFDEDTCPEFHEACAIVDGITTCLEYAIEETYNEFDVEIRSRDTIVELQSTLRNLLIASQWGRTPPKKVISNDTAVAPDGFYRFLLASLAYAELEADANLGFSLEAYGFFFTEFYNELWRYGLVWYGAN